MRLNLWDTAGHEKFMGITKQYVRDAGAAVIVRSVSGRSRFAWLGC